MNRSPEEMKLLEEKIARIRKNNEAIIRKKEIIEEEIRQAKLKNGNAVVNPSKPYSDEPDDMPTLYSDSVEENKTRKITNVAYTNMGQEKRRPFAVNVNEEEAWRRERKQIDSERIRRQKAESGWKREWDAHKEIDVIGDDHNFGWERKQGDRNASQRKFNGEKYDDNSRYNHRKFNEEFEGDSRSSHRKFSDEDLDRRRNNHYDAPKKTTNVKEESWDSKPTSLPMKQSASKSHRDGLSTPNTNMSNNRRNAEDPNAKISNSWRSAEPSRKRSDSKPSRNNSRTDCLKRDEVNADKSNNNSCKVRSTSGPLILNKNTAASDNVMELSNCKVSKYSVTIAESISKNVSWKQNDKFDLEKLNLNERLKNIVVRVKSEDDKPTERIVEIVEEQKPKNAAADDSKSMKQASSTRISTVTFERTDVPSGNVFVPQTANAPPYQSSTVGSSSVPKNITVSVLPDKTRHAKNTSVKSKSPPVGILKNKLDVLPAHTSKIKSKSEENTMKEAKEVALPDDDDNDEWEDVSEEEWEDVSEEEAE